MYLCHIVSNSGKRSMPWCSSCELLSKCIFVISFPIFVYCFRRAVMLWIAFKMYLCHIVSNYSLYHCYHFCVVNCFQNVSLSYRFQSRPFAVLVNGCCELLSKCIFVISFPIIDVRVPNRKLLWIAFKMYLCHIVSNGAFFYPRLKWLWIAFKMYLCHIVSNVNQHGKGTGNVVNCFQNVSLSYRFQCPDSIAASVGCCELLSKCIFVISFPIHFCP